MPRRDKTGMNVCPKRLKLAHVALSLAAVFVVFHAASLYRALSLRAVEDATLRVVSTETNKDEEIMADSGTCHSDACLEAQAARLARVWTRHSHRDWCVRSDDDGDAANTGLVLIKVPKSASSTMAGLVLRITELYRCAAVRWQHAKAVDVMADITTSHTNDTTTTTTTSASWRRRRTFWMAPIRHPHARTLSSVYYHTVSLRAAAAAGRRGTPVSDAHVLRQLDRVEDDYITDYTRVVASTTTDDGHHYNNSSSSSSNNNTRNPSRPRVVVREILQHYDFLLVVEDMEASLVVLAWLADLRLSDVLLMSSKSTGSWYATGRGTCVPLIPPQVTPAVRAYWNNTSRRRHWTDRLLHAAARHSLHRTIQEGMGRALFAQRLAALRRIQTVVQRACGTVMNESAPCSPTGVYQPEKAKEACYLRDFGCGHVCVDQAVKRMS